MVGELDHRLVHASQARKRLISDLALEALVGRKPVRQIEELDKDPGSTRGKGWKSSAGRWRRMVDYRFPAPLDGRRITDTGGSSFHYRISSISKARPAAIS